MFGPVTKQGRDAKLQQRQQHQNAVAEFKEIQNVAGARVRDGLGGSLGRKRVIALALRLLLICLRWAGRVLRDRRRDRRSGGSAARLAEKRRHSQEEKGE